jgi:hypothetical protein
MTGFKRRRAIRETSDQRRDEKFASWSMEGEKIVKWSVCTSAAGDALLGPEFMGKQFALKNLWLWLLLLFAWLL